MLRGWQGNDHELRRKVTMELLYIAKKGSMICT
jgi:hypothetical protein